MSHKAFVSSTCLDLAQHREKVIGSLRKAGFHVDPMEDWPADHREPKNISLERFDDCDLCVLIVARRRGHVPKGAELSITQMEAKEAAERGLDLLVFVLDDAADWPADFDERVVDPLLDAWRSELQEKHVVGFFGAEPSSIDVGPALTRWAVERKSTDHSGVSVSVLGGADLEDVEADSVVGAHNAEDTVEVSVLDRSKLRRVKLGNVTGLTRDSGSKGADDR